MQPASSSARRCGWQRKSAGRGDPRSHRWPPRGDGTFVFRHEEMQGWEACLAHVSIRLPDELPEASAFGAALGADAVIGARLDKLVGTALASMRVDEGTLARSLVCEVAREAGSLSPSSADFDEAYDRWYAGATAVNASLPAVAPLEINFAGEFELDDRIVIGQMSDAQIGLALALGLIRSPLMGSGFAHVGSGAAAKFDVELPIIVDTEGNVDTDVGTGVHQRLADDAGAVAVALRLLKPGRVIARGVVIQQHNERSGASVPVSYGAPVGLGSPLELLDSEVDELRALWKKLQAAGANSVIDAAVRRFAYAGERHRTEDSVVDLVIAMEGLLLADAGRAAERGEMRYRMALRGAVLLGEDAAAKQRLHSFLKRAYDVRSALVHGGTPPADRLKDESEAPTTLVEFTAATERVARQALRAAIDRVADGRAWPPKWDELILQP